MSYEGTIVLLRVFNFCFIFPLGEAPASYKQFSLSLSIFITQLYFSPQFNNKLIKRQYTSFISHLLLLKIQSTTVQEIWLVYNILFILRFSSFLFQVSYILHLFCPAATSFQKPLFLRMCPLIQFIAFLTLHLLPFPFTLFLSILSHNHISNHSRSYFYSNIPSIQAIEPIYQLQLFLISNNLYFTKVFSAADFCFPWHDKLNRLSSFEKYFPAQFFFGSLAVIFQMICPA